MSRRTELNGGLKGEEVDYVVTYLEMNKRPIYPRPSAQFSAPLSLLHAEKPPNWYFLALYRAVGEAHEWTDQLERPAHELRKWLHDEKVALYTLLQAGWPAGFFVLDARQEGICDLAYFGLVPEMVGRGLGRYLLQTAVHMGWDYTRVEKLTLNTNTLDHPRALALYQRSGFVPVRQERHSRVLSRDYM